MNIITIIGFIVYMAVAFLLVSQKMMYTITNSVTSILGITTSVDGEPNTNGLILHGVVLALIACLLWFSNRKNFILN